MHFSTKTKLYPQHPQDVLTLLHYEQPHPKTLTHDPRWTTHSHSWSSGFFCLNKPRVLLALLLMCTLFLLYISHVWPAWSWVKDLYPKYVYLLMTWSAREKKNLICEPGQCQLQQDVSRLGAREESLKMSWLSFPKVFNSADDITLELVEDSTLVPASHWNDNLQWPGLGPTHCEHHQWDKEDPELCQAKSVPIIIWFTAVTLTKPILDRSVT